HRRALVENMKDKPFLILGVNSDPKFKVQETMKRENLTWRSFWDGGTTRGPIARQYDISDWPTIYLIDHLGVIRHKQLQGAEILEAVEGLVAKIAAAPPKQLSLRSFVDNTGQFTIVARFVEFKNGQAYLEKSDGTVVTLSMNKLSKEDQRYIREVLKTRQ
ncbi:MAG: redoxin domain-containing protein, partial [Planctomycetaceae bacterium]|nr:redoxin domain-containing protein [Planctomycetaceae bacterium]